MLLAHLFVTGVRSRLGVVRGVSLPPLGGLFRGGPPILFLFSCGPPAGVTLPPWRVASFVILLPVLLL